MNGSKRGLRGEGGIRPLCGAVRYETVHWTLSLRSVRILYHISANKKPPLRVAFRWNWT
ncbi:MAG: hypothetical protein ACOX6G_10530 [Christensenellales bacterium]|nr:hypothetical protein [Clostridiales bacterium]